jgi:alkylhydroperoxidase family enzyme
MPSAAVGARERITIMARLPYLDTSDLDPSDHDLLARPITLHRELVHSPGMARAFVGLGEYIRHHSPLDARLRELAILQVGWLARSPYEWSHHIKIGHDFGVTDDDIWALIDDTAGRPSALDSFDRTVLLAAREMVAGGVSAPTFAALRARLDAACVVDLIATIGFYCGVVRVLASLEIDVEPEFVPYLERFPLPAA